MTHNSDDFEIDSSDFISPPVEIIPEPPSNKLERRRKIEDLFEEKRLKKELDDFDLPVV